VAALAKQFDVHPRHIDTAIDFAATHREVIQRQIAANDRAAEQARACCPPRRAESVILACGSPTPGDLMPLSRGQDSNATSGL
jgi:hypothetical protein